MKLLMVITRPCTKNAIILIISFEEIHEVFNKVETKELTTNKECINIWIDFPYMVCKIRCEQHIRVRPPMREIYGVLCKSNIGSMIWLKDFSFPPLDKRFIIHNCFLLDLITKRAPLQVQFLSQSTRIWANLSDFCWCFAPRETQTCA